MVVAHFHTGSVVDCLARVDTHENILRYVIFAIDIMQLDAYLVGKTHKVIANSPLLRQTVILKFDIKISLGKHILKPQRILFCAIIISRRQQSGNTSGQTRRKTYHAFAVPLKQIKVYSRLVIISVYIRERIHLDKVFISLVVFGDKHQVIALCADIALHIFASVELATNYRLEVTRVGCLIESIRAEHIAVVGESAPRHTKFFTRI